MRFLQLRTNASSHITSHNSCSKYTWPPHTQQTGATCIGSRDVTGQSKGNVMGQEQPHATKVAAGVVEDRTTQLITNRQSLDSECNVLSLPAIRSATSPALPWIARPTRHVSPTMRPALLRRQLMRCRVASMPARLSPPNSPTCTA
jgi:hypothetical protein